MKIGNQLALILAFQSLPSLPGLPTSELERDRGAR
jgi:hypothetical protein